MSLSQKIRQSKLLRAATLASALTCSTLNSSCSSNNPTDPIVTPPEQYTLEDHVQQLPTNNITQYNPTTGQITFESQQDIQNLHTGDIIIAGVSSNTPSGLLRKIDNIQGTILQTSRATLNDAIEEGNLTLENTRLTPTNKSLTTKEGFDFNIPFVDFVLYDADNNLTTTDDQITLTGNLSFNANITDFNLVVSPEGLEEFTFNTNTTESLSLNLNSETSITLSRSYQLYPDIYCTPIPIGPFIIVPVVEINANLDGEVSISNAHASQTANLDVGINYSNSTWTPSANFTNEFSYELPTLTEDATLSVSVGPEVKLLVYDLAGVSSEVLGNLRLEVNNLETPWWKLYGGLEASIAANLEFFGWPIAEYSTGVVSLEELLAQADIPVNQPPGTPLFPTPTNNATNIELNTYLAWACFDPEEDPLTFDIYFGTQENPTELIADDISLGYLELQNLEYLTNYYWKVIANDGEFQTPGPIWHFTTLEEPQQSADKIVFSSNKTGDYDLYLANLDGTNVTALLVSPTSDESTPTSSPDGQKIAFFSDMTNPQQGIYTINIDGTNLEFLTSGNYPTWSPDGQKIAFIDYQPTIEGDIYTINPDGTDRRLINNQPTTKTLMPITWLGNEQIVYSYTPNPNAPSSLYKILVTTNSTPEILVSNSRTNNYPCGSLDGSQVVFRSYQSGNFDLYTVNADGTNLNRVNTTTSTNHDPYWTTDVSGIVFTRATNAYTSDICYINSDGTEERVIIDESLSDREPAIVPGNK